MYQPPSPARFPAFPATAGVALLAIATTLLYWSSPAAVEPLTMSWRALHGEPWRLLTSALPHANLIHLVFNLYWIWTFGTALEARFGHFWMFLLMSVLAAVSAAAEYALFGGGIGLSGVGYGLFGVAWMLARHDRRLALLVDGRTVALFLGWGLLCILTTILDLLPIANAAHAAGLALGVLIGLGVVRARVWLLAAAALIALTALAVTVGRPFINLSRVRSAHELAYAGQQLSDAGQPAEAVRRYREALRFERKPSYEVNFGYLLKHMGPDRQGEARVHLHAGCDGGEAAGCVNLAIMLENGEGGAVDLAGARTLYSAACDRADAVGCANLGRLVQMDMDFVRAEALYQRACDGGIKRSCAYRDELRGYNNSSPQGAK